MAYQVIARKWRPSNFDALLGQEHIVNSLKNSISKGTIHHGYLFSGPRGVGKTSAARILAKAVNCLNPNGAEPCNKCVNCKEIGDGMSIDVVELDGASNRGVDDIRELRTLVNYLPTKSKYKIFIIDEVHQLTPQAFDALLKTLEEPPPHIIFILATTSAHKVKETIRSRCLHYNFKRISIGIISEHLLSICNEMKITADIDSMKLIAKAGDGSMRDSQSILEAIVSFSEGNITTDKVRSVLGLTAEEFYIKFINYVSEKKLAELILLIDQLIVDGHDISHYVIELLDYFRAIVIIKSLPDKAHMFLSYSDETMSDLKRISNIFTKFQIAEIINQMVNLIKELKNTTNERFSIESTIYKIINWDNFTSLGEIVKRIESMEQRVIASTDGSSIRIFDNTSHISTSNVRAQTHSETAKVDPNMNEDEIFSIWMKQIFKEKSLTAQVLNQLVSRTWNPETSVLEITFDNDFCYHKCNEEQTKLYLQQSFSQLVKKPVSVMIKFQKKNLTPRELEKIKKNQELLLEMFDGELIE